MRLEQFLSDSAARYGQRPVVVCGGRSHTYGELDRASDRVAAALARGGVARGDRVALYMDDNFEAVVAAFAVLKAGAVATPLEPDMDAGEFSFALRYSGAVALITEARLASSAASAMAAASSVRLVLLRGGDKATTTPGCLVFEEVASGIGPGPTIERAGPASDVALHISTPDSSTPTANAHLTHAEVIAAAGVVASEGPRRLSSVLSLDGVCQLIAAVRAGATLVLETPSAFRRALSTRVEPDGAVPALAG